MSTFDSGALVSDSAERKEIPLTRGLLDYFPNALAEVARVSKSGNDQHNKGQPIHWARGKSTDHADCIVRHLIDRGRFDSDGMRHSAKVAWRALALLQEELEAEGQAPLSRGSSLPEQAYDEHGIKVDRPDPLKFLEKSMAASVARSATTRPASATEADQPPPRGTKPSRRPAPG